MWGFFTQLALNGGSQAKAYYCRPVTTNLLPLTAADFFEMPLPASVAGLAQRVSWAKYEGRDYGVGGWTDNLIWTEHMEMVRQGIDAPNVVPDVQLVAGPGITANVICHLAYFDWKTGERSSLSAPSATLVAANQQVEWTTFPTPLDPRPTHIELWRSVDGGLPRLVMRRQLGVTTVTEAVALGDLGEAFTEAFERFPRCRFNAIYHERQVMAGDDEHPDTLYLSSLNAPERWGGLTLRTRNGERIIGLIVVRDRLIVICPFSRYSVFGYTEDDLEMQISEPQIGGLNHWSVAMVHGNAWLWTHLGLYLSDASSSFYVTNDIERKFGEQYQGHQDAYENAFAVHDPVRHVVKLYVGEHDDLPGVFGYWVANYDDVVSQVGGQLGQPRWSYDARARPDYSAGLLALPGGRRQELYTGSCDGFVRLENRETDDGDDSDTYEKKLIIRHGANFLLDVGGNLAGGKRFGPPLDVFVQSELTPWTINFYTGDEYAYPTPEEHIPFTKLVPESEAGEVPFGDQYQPKTTHQFVLRHCVGRAYVLEVVAALPEQFRYRGHQLYWLPGPAPRFVSTVTSDPG